MSWKRIILKVRKNPRGYIKTRSSWEVAVAQVLENTPTVVKWVYEYPIRYIDPITRKRRFYFLDFLAWLRNGRKVAIEVKSPSLLKFNKSYTSPAVKKWHIQEVVRNKKKLLVLQEEARRRGWQVIVLFGKDEVKKLKSILNS